MTWSIHIFLRFTNITRKYGALFSRRFVVGLLNFVENVFFRGFQSDFGQDLERGGKTCTPGGVPAPGFEETKHA